MSVNRPRRGVLSRHVARGGVMEASEVRKRAAGGAVLIAAKSAAIQLLGLFGSVVLARLLVPSEFGSYTLAVTIALVLGNLAGPGMASVLIRQAAEPARDDLRTLLTIQLGVTLIVASCGAAVAWQLGELGQITAVMLVTLPLMALRGPGVVLFERELAYRPLVAIELAESACFYAWSIGTVAIGWGVWGLATAAIVRAAVGTILVLVLAPVGFVAVGFSRVRARALVSMGARVQAVDFVGVARDHGLNFGIAAIAGVSVLGLYALAQRLLQAPILLMTALWRVSFPAMSRLIAAGEDPQPIIERTVRVVAAALGLLVAPLAAASPALVPSVFGARWAEAADLIPFACLSFMVSVPVSIALTGMLWAIGDARTPLRAAVLHTLALGAVGLPLLRPLGILGLGIAIAVSNVVDAVILIRAKAAPRDLRFLIPVAKATIVALVAGTTGWTIAVSAGPSLASAATSATVACAIYIVGLRAVSREVAIETVSAARSAMRAGRRSAPR